MNNTWVRLTLLAVFLVGVYVVGRTTGFTEGLTVEGIPTLSASAFSTSLR